MPEVLVDQTALPAPELAVDLAHLLNPVAAGQPYDAEKARTAWDNREMLEARDLAGVIGRNSQAEVIEARLREQKPNESSSDIWRYVVTSEDVIWGMATIWFDVELRQLVTKKNGQPVSSGLISRLMGKDFRISSLGPNINAWVGAGSPDGLLEAAYKDAVDLSGPFVEENDTLVYAVEPVNNRNGSSALDLAHRAIVAAGLERGKDGFFILGGEQTRHSTLYVA